MVKTSLKMLASLADWCISAILTGLFVGWIFGYVHTYSLFGKYFIVIG